jgi:hypothetical protein
MSAATGNGTENGEQPPIVGLDPRSRVVRSPIASPAKRSRPGRQVPPDWPPRFVEFYAKHGVRWRAAKYAGVSHDTVLRTEQADPIFARQVEDARQTYLDRHALNLNRLAFKKNNVVASIVALKAGRPSEYVEKAMSISLTANTTLAPADGKALLQAMFGHTAPPQALETGSNEPSRVLDANPNGSADTSE